uniref:ditrans,polycis-polyprenyl diphosphate synthase [(2E,6E)-farnesyldiphosphate specific] n=1 Tax=Scophthalmus maximus TaxID=52904 RepID=A0A8D3DC49_SCOMX
MALLHGFLWRLLLVLVHVNRALVSWLRVRLRSLKGRLWERMVAALLLPVALAGFPDHRRKFNRNPGANANSVTGNCALTDISNLVVWCMAVGISYVSVYDNHGDNRKQQDLLGVDGSKHNVECCLQTMGSRASSQAAQQLCRSVENKERSSRDISVTMLDIMLRERSRPELVVKFGPVDSTLGFLPWHIRLTEFISLPSHRNVSYEDLFGALQRYGACQQRLGQ